MNQQTTPNKAPKRCVLSINTKLEVRNRLDKLAQQTRRSKSFLANEAIEHYLQAEEAFVARIEQRKEEAQAGDLITSEELLSRFQARMEDKFNTKT
jgi:predicted transcriptional regulator